MFGFRRRMARRTARRTSRRVSRPQPPSEAPGSAPDPTAELKKLADPHAQGVLTDAEFAAKKKQILGI